ncbi:DgyrCDS936 [Dimorphilus gyrociliatus]|uniref:DgyrCDS936 n=1 Tax=Dimorphilus gyrociliatus TaxID=2664684 RepID=A0A7I8VAT6_9ANNE|nr:DgyrCDS936 [Dimorphilus gyrociliatus]
MNKLESVEYRLVKRLFKDYNKDVRPKKDPTKAIYVDIAFYLGKIDQLNEKEQYLMSYGWLGLSWFDEFLKWNKTEEKVDYIIVPYDKVWLPELCLKNSITESNDLTVKLKYKIKVQHNGNVVYVPGANFLTSCKVQLTYFPFDVQVCHLEFVKWMTFNDQMEYRNSTTDVNLQLFVQNHEWTILETKSGVKPVIVANKGGLDLFYATIVLKRKPLYYTMTLTFPLCLTTILTFYMFLLPCESGEKVSLGISVLLSYSVLLLLISDILPRNSETAPLLMIIVLMNMTFTAFCLLITVIIINIHHHSPEKPMPSWLKTFLFDYVANLVFCKICVCRKKIDCKCDDKMGLEKKNAFNENINEFYTTVNLSNEVKEFIRKKIADDTEQDSLDKSRKEWNKAARILDRFWAILMSVVLVIYLSIILNHLATAGNNYTTEDNLS